MSPSPVVAQAGLALGHGGLGRGSRWAQVVTGSRGSIPWASLTQWPPGPRSPSPPLKYRFRKAMPNFRASLLRFLFRDWVCLPHGGVLKDEVSSTPPGTPALCRDTQCTQGSVSSRGAEGAHCPVRQRRLTGQTFTQCPSVVHGAGLTEWTRPAAQSQAAGCTAGTFQGALSVASQVPVPPCLPRSIY